MITVPTHLADRTGGPVSVSDQIFVDPPPSAVRCGADSPPPTSAPHRMRPCIRRVVAWVDPVVDTLGYDPRSWYVEQFWLPIVGPTSTWFLRRIAAGFDSEPGGFDLNLDEMARALGLGGR